ncbi:hypothetical protein AAFF_G00385010 [Aldrovandia affinis]|uniref:Uncharacterized protein n=1 Tax=Aldrovandia affinis TaxID=143900 RepID=A0AAD7SET5_9TELE|nr:hypothetical protein AAFF_G00385010 [Aldrovandia affinis]
METPNFAETKRNLLPDAVQHIYCVELPHCVLTLTLCIGRRHTWRRGQVTSCVPESDSEGSGHLVGAGGLGTRPSDGRTHGRTHARRRRTNEPEPEELASCLATSRCEELAVTLPG